MRCLKFLLIFCMFISLVIATNAYDIKEYYNVDDDSQVAVYNNNWYAQTFNTSVGYDIKVVGVKVFRVGSPGNINIMIFPTNVTGHPDCSSSALTSGTFNGNAITDSSPGEWANTTLSSTYTLLANTTYAIVMNLTGGVANYIDWRIDGSSATYSGGSRAASSTGINGWSLNVDDDMMFETYDATNDTCTYNSGDWDVTASDSCAWTSNVDVSGNDWTITGSGTVTITNINISNVNSLTLEGSVLVINGGGVTIQ